MDRIQIDGLQTTAADQEILVIVGEAPTESTRTRKNGNKSFSSSTWQILKENAGGDGTYCTDMEEEEQRIGFRLRVRCGLVEGRFVHVLAKGAISLRVQAKIYVHLIGDLAEYHGGASSRVTDRSGADFSRDSLNGFVGPSVRNV